MPSVAWVVEFDACNRIAAELPGEAAKILRYGANLARRNARRRLSSRTRAWLRGKQDRLYQASQPGMAPARVTGELMRAARVTRTGKLTFEFGFGTGKGGMDHVARLLEGGSARIAPRPFFAQSVTEAVAATEKELEELLDIEVNPTTSRVIWRRGSTGREIVSEDVVE